MTRTKMWCSECGRSRSVCDALARKLGTRYYLCDVCRRDLPSEDDMREEQPDEILA